MKDFRIAVLQLLEDSSRSQTFSDLVSKLGLQGEKEIRQLHKELEIMETEATVIKNRNGRYNLPARMGYLTGKVQGHSRGFAFLLPDNPKEADVFLSPESLNGAMHGDRVLVRVDGKEGRRREGEVVRVIERARLRLVGSFEASRRYGFVVPDDRRISYDIYVPYSGRRQRKPARTGDKVVVEIDRWPSRGKKAEGHIVEVLGKEGTPGVDIIAIVKQHDLRTDFPEKVLREAESLPDGITSDDLKDREDLRHLTCCTIDGADAKDLDDAVSIEELPGGKFRLGVHIADVSHYVVEGSALDREALERGTSTYLVDRVLPMLPPRLSNGICSLNPRVDRLTLSVMMDISADGEVEDYEFAPSVIRTRERMTYDEVRRILEDKDPELRDRFQEMVPAFQAMKKLALLLRDQRMRRGALDFNLPEAKIKVDEQGKPVSVEPRTRTIAEQIIEEFMLVCNEVVATHFYHLKVPFLYRVHPKPDPDKLLTFRDFAAGFGLNLAGQVERITPRRLQRLLSAVAGHPEEKVINYVLLRSMPQAVYSGTEQGHFGLAAPYYCHFTSPIRRYPDLVVHRVMKAVLSGDKNSRRRLHNSLGKKIEKIALHCSSQERKAAAAERECDELKMVEYMQDHIGEEYPGIISGVTSFGFFVQLENTVEGLVRVENLQDDHYQFHEKQFALVGQRTSRRFRLGDPVRVRVERANLDNRTIDFSLIQ